MVNWKTVAALALRDIPTTNITPENLFGFLPDNVKNDQASVDDIVKAVNDAVERLTAVPQSSRTTAIIYLNEARWNLRCVTLSGRDICSTNITLRKERIRLIGQAAYEGLLAWYAISERQTYSADSVVSLCDRWTSGSEPADYLGHIMAWACTIREYAVELDAFRQSKIFDPLTVCDRDIRTLFDAVDAMLLYIGVSLSKDMPLWQKSVAVCLLQHTAICVCLDTVCELMPESLKQDYVNHTEISEAVEAALRIIPKDRLTVVSYSTERE